MPPLNTVSRSAIAIAIGQALTASPVQAATINVNSPLDNGDGANCTLREAVLSISNGSVQGGCINSGSSFGVNDRISFTAAAGNSIGLTQALPLTLDSSSVTLTIDGPTQQSLEINGNDNANVFKVESGADVTINNLTISGGRAYSGGGISVDYSGQVSLANSTVSGNSAERFGAGISVQRSSMLSLVNSTVSGNINETLLSISSNGGGIAVVSNSEASLLNTTVSGNTAQSRGGGIYTGSQATLTLTNSLIAGNSALYRGAEISSVSATINSGSHNFFADTSNTNAEAFDGFSPSGNDISNTSSGRGGVSLSDILEPLSDNGGSTATHALLPDSPARDQVDDNSCPMTDQRGEPRGLDQECDIGAYEFKPVTITVDNLNDDNGAGCTLREAMATVNAQTPQANGCVVNGTFGDRETINFDVSGNATITLLNSPLMIDSSSVTLSIDGPRQHALEINGNNNVGVFDIRFGATVALNNVTISGGSAALGGGIRLVSAFVDLENTTVSGNSANLGGAVHLSQGSDITMLNSTVSGNSATTAGGAIYADSSSFLLENATVSNNSASRGGGISLVSASNADFITSLISGNQAANPGVEIDAQGGSVVNSGSPYVSMFGHRAISNSQAFAGFTPRPENITATSNGNNPTALSNILKPLANNGGPTATHVLAVNSPARDSGFLSRCPPEDQRGFARDDGGLVCDLGAVEFQPEDDVSDDEGFFVIPIGNGRAVVVPN